MKKYIVLLCSFILAMTMMVGCSSNTIQNVQQISYICGVGDYDQTDYYTISSDLHMQHYSFTSEDMDFSKLLSGEQPPESTLVDEKDISQEQWDNILDVAQENDFLNLPENLSAGDDTCDGDTYYIELQTDEQTYRSGGYAAGIGTDTNDKRFANVRDAIEEIL